jgi:saccharopine dehydrogenase-like NADP-dependent oxidoreductase
MQEVLVCGAGKIGQFAAVLLGRAHYRVTLLDARDPDPHHEILLKQYPEISYKKISITDESALDNFFKEKKFTALVSCVHSSLNIPLAKQALQHQVHYLNLSEDRETKAQIFEIGRQAKTAFVPQCGIAPGLVDIVAHNLMQKFDKLKSAKLSVGALPQQVSNPIHYELSWSIDGLVNEYINPCHVVEEGVDKEVAALSGLEVLNIEGETYEMFHTSGGLGTLGDFYKDKLDEMHYKTIRYQGHVAAMQELFAGHNHEHDSLAKWFQENIPFTTQDMVMLYVCITGMIGDEFSERSFMHKWYPQELDGNSWSAIQWTTASEICALCDMVICNPGKYQGLIQHQDVDYEELINNRFMRYFELV